MSAAYIDPRIAALRAGDLDRVLTIQRATVTVDANGAPVSTWADLTTLRAKQLSDNATIDTEHGGTAMTAVQIKFLTRFYSNGPTLEDRVVYEGLPYQIKYISEIGRRRGLELHIEKLGNAGP